MTSKLSGVGDIVHPQRHLAISVTDDLWTQLITDPCSTELQLYNMGTISLGV